MKHKKGWPALDLRRRRRLKLFLMVLPVVLMVFVFHYVPLFGWAYGFVDYIPGLPLREQTFVGFKYFKLLFSGISEFPVVLRNTLVLSSLRILTMVFPILFAIAVNQLYSRRLSRFVQVAASIPNFISWVLVFAIFFVIFSAEDGAFNTLMMGLGLIDTPTNLLGSDSAAWGFQTFVSVWKLTGWEAIIYLAAIAGIDPELYDAAAVDGAGRLQRILHVTLPGIMPTFFVLLLLAIANILSNGATGTNAFEQYYVFQNPMVLDKLQVFDTYIYQMGIVGGQYAYATAMGLLKSIVSILLLVLANLASKLIRKESIF